ncbi:hypothetical protein AV530_006458 [Patagioenas fasciata monilis]|uniref:Uncharacterized protein n=1 Tax=Patagioenas fasciata monilis TaxID=372326 RepID=A0A1V4KGM7_PATFA|nr:hypothetical protein AV530_006458 [Patagioenas fasciata monilis]
MQPDIRYGSQRIRYDANLDHIQNEEKDVVLHVTCSGPVEILAKGCCIQMKAEWTNFWNFSIWLKACAK